MGYPRRPMPEDFTEHMYEPIPVLRKYYHTSDDAIQRWRNECGVCIRKERPVNQFALNGELVAQHESILSATKSIYGTYSYIRRCLAGETETAYGYVWRYADVKVQRST